MMTHRGSECLNEPLPLSLTEPRRLLKASLGLLGKGRDVFAQFKELMFRLTNELNQDFALASTAAAKAAHDFGETVLQDLNLPLESGAAATAQLGDTDNEL
jgi:hypothetical protein